MMKEPIRKVSKNLLRILVFLIFFTMFAVGVSHFFLKFPVSVQQPFIKIRRSLSGAYHKAKLSFPNVISDEVKATSLQVLLSSDALDVLFWCGKFRESESHKLQSKVRQCLLQKESAKNLLPFVKQIIEEDGGGTLSDQYLNSLQINPESTEALQWLTRENRIGKMGLVQVLGVLLQRKQGQESDVEYLVTLIENENENPEVKMQAALVMARIDPTNKALTDLHKTKVEKNANNIESSLHFLAVQEPQSLRDDFLSLYKSLSLENRLFLLKEIKILCPVVELEQWQELFFQSNQFKEKKALMVALLNYQGRRRSDKIQLFLDDLKLRPKEKEELTSLIKRDKPEPCP